MSKLQNEEDGHGRTMRCGSSHPQITIDLCVPGSLQRWYSAEMPHWSSFLHQAQLDSNSWGGRQLVNAALFPQMVGRSSAQHRNHSNMGRTREDKLHWNKKYYCKAGLNIETKYGNSLKNCYIKNHSSMKKLVVWWKTKSAFLFWLYLHTPMPGVTRLCRFSVLQEKRSAKSQQDIKANNMEMRAYY